MFNRVAPGPEIVDLVLDPNRTLPTRARRVQHFLDPDPDPDRILITLLIFSRNIFLYLYLVIALEIRISSFPLICIGTSAPDTFLRRSRR